MSNTSQRALMSADLRDIIQMDSDALVNLVFNGKPIQGTKGDLVNSADLDSDGGGIYEQADITATFVFSDFPTKPVGDEIVQLDKMQKRILRVTVDDFGAAIAIAFGRKNQD